MAGRARRSYGLRPRAPQGSASRGPGWSRSAPRRGPGRRPWVLLLLALGIVACLVAVGAFLWHPRDGSLRPLLWRERLTQRRPALRRREPQQALLIAHALRGRFPRRVEPGRRDNHAVL